MALPRYGTTTEIVEMVAYLADPTLYITGAILTIDGRSTAQQIK